MLLLRILQLIGIEKETNDELEENYINEQSGECLEESTVEEEDSFMTTN